MLDHRASTMRQKLPDNTYKHLLKVPLIKIRIQVLVHMNLKKWVKTSIMQLPNTRTKLTTKSIQGLDYHKLPEDQPSTWVQLHIQQTYRT